MKPPLSAPFLVPASLYLILAAYSMVFGIKKLMVVIPLFEKPDVLSPLLVYSVIGVFVIWFAKNLFYLVLVVLLISRISRKPTLILAAISCLLPPIATIAGATVLLWTRRHWPKPGHSDQTALP